MYSRRSSLGYILTFVCFFLECEKNIEKYSYDFFETIFTKKKSLKVLILILWFRKIHLDKRPNQWWKWKKISVFERHYSVFVDFSFCYMMSVSITYNKNKMHKKRWHRQKVLICGDFFSIHALNIHDFVFVEDFVVCRSQALHAYIYQKQIFAHSYFFISIIIV